MSARFATLPAYLTFRTGADLIRLGRDNDGGYLVSAKDVACSRALVSLGISEDWSFEENFLAFNKVPVHAFDASVSQWTLLQRYLKSLRNFRNRRLRRVIGVRLKTLLGYRRFFGQPGVVHVRKYVDSRKSGRRFCTLASVLDAIKQEPIFLKIDIEGSEFSFLDELLKRQDRISGLAIEFHMYAGTEEALQSFIERLELQLIHVHANNAVIRESDGNPRVIELTFSRYGACLSETLLPHPLDMPNIGNRPEIHLRLAADETKT